MFSEEISTIIIKYASTDKKEIIEINKSLDSIKLQMQSILNNIASEANKRIADATDNTDITDILIQDSKQIKKFISQIDLLPIEEIQESDYGQMPKDEFPVLISILPDDICPFCNVKTEEYSITYKEKGVKKAINGCKCPACNRLFMTYYVAETLPLVKYANVKFDFSHCNKLSIYNDVYVVNDITSCSKNNHQFKEMKCSLPIVNFNGGIVSILSSVTQCTECERTYMLKSEYEHIITQGIPLIPIVDETKVKPSSNSSNHTCSNNDSGSKLTKYGYNVNCVSKLSDEQRKMILEFLIRYDLMQRNEIISFLNKNINNGEQRTQADHKNDWTNAVNKWKDDREYVLTLDRGQQNEKMEAAKLILAYYN